jgi:putative zinc finger/helix-turn-helix YgiT family protein
MKHGRTTVEGRYRGRVYKVQASAHVCSKCGYYLVEASDTPELMRNLSDAYRSEMGLLTSDQIRGYRESLGLSQQRFAEYLKVGVASIKRWELGGVQDSVNDDHIRLKCDAAYAAANAASVKGLHEVAADMKVFVERIQLQKTAMGMTAIAGFGTTGSSGANVVWPAANQGFAHSA